MATTERYTTVIELNSEQAKRNLDQLRKEVEKYEKALEDVRNNSPRDNKAIDAAKKQLKEAEKELRKYDNEVVRTIDTLNNLGSASVKQIENAQKQLRSMSKSVPVDEEAYQKLNDLLDTAHQELENIKAVKAFEKLQLEATGATKSAEQLQAELAFIKQTAENAETASVKQLQLAERTAQNIKDSAGKGSNEWKQASAGLETVRTRLDAIEEEERKVVTLIDRYNKELEEANKGAAKVKDETELINRTLSKIDSASVRDIEYSIKALNEQLRDTERTGGNVEDLTNKLKQLNAELEKVRDMQKPDAKKDNIFSRFTTFLNKNWGAITQALGAISGLSFTIRKAVSAYSDMEQEMANVRKYTGQAAEEVERMNEDFKHMDTRTAREELNQLAGVAGRLGIQATKEIEEFVDASDKIRVALGDDLGDDAVDKIGKLAMAFGEDDKLGLRGAMLATGSAVNELAQNSSAQAGYLVDFTARVAGFGKQLGLTKAQIMGFGAVMDENLLRDEMASTAFGNMLTKMQTDTETFAQIAGMKVKAFTDLLNKDANQAILRIADSLRQQDPQNMMKMLDAMGLDGSRAVGVLATLADKVDDVRIRQNLAAEAYKQGTSVLEEYNIQNTTVQAETEKAKKRFHDLTIELGERLLPVVRYTISGSSLLVKALAAITSFMFENKTAILTTTAAVAGYTVAVNAATVAAKLHAAATKVARIAMELFNRATKMSPIGLLVAALTAATVLFLKYRDRIRGASEATTLLRSAGAKLVGVLAQVSGWIAGLIKLAAKLYDKFSFIRKIIQLLTITFTTGFATITNAVAFLIDELSGVANIIEGIFTLDWDKVKDGFKRGVKAVADVAKREWNVVKGAVKDTFSAPPAPNAGNVVKAGETKGREMATTKKETTKTSVEPTVN
ncbi:MAG: phage tail tape measure protein, partial [Bacteroidaceae bacterium]|nr:phage tail tape measure protein [Bacteroidaceae bacterium]